MHVVLVSQEQHCRNTPSWRSKLEAGHANSAS